MYRYLGTGSSTISTTKNVAENAKRGLGHAFLSNNFSAEFIRPACIVAFMWRAPALAAAVAVCRLHDVRCLGVQIRRGVG